MTTMLLWMLSLLCFSCEKSDMTTVVSEVAGLKLVDTIKNESHIIELYTTNDSFQVGYNAVYIQVKNKDGSLVAIDTASWQPIMQMMTMSHSCPFSAIQKKINTKYTYQGYLIFQMASNTMEYWNLTINYTISGTSYTATSQINVKNPSKRVLQSFTGSDSKRYILAMIDPTSPRVASNDMNVLLYRMETMMNFVTASNFKIKIDPRMPSMGNHSSPNNVDLTQGSDVMYSGKLNLTMTGYWKINLQLEDASGTNIKGEAITSANEASSIYFELEF